MTNAHWLSMGTMITVGKEFVKVIVITGQHFLLKDHLEDAILLKALERNFSSASQRIEWCATLTQPLYRW